ncbi:MAG: hypothetical protein GC158_01205 [Cyanobacteria bacterium RI_101]|nr:hypothetical protein [Cyanobacteria bacterium RI_101]
MFKSLPNSSVERPSTSIPLLIFGAVGLCALASAYLGYRLGDEAIKGVAQPSENPVQRLNLPQTSADKDEKAPTQPTVKFVPLNIEQVRKDAKAYIKARQKTVKGQANSAQDGK